MQQVAEELYEQKGKIEALEAYLAEARESADSSEERNQVLQDRLAKTEARALSDSRQRYCIIITHRYSSFCYSQRILFPHRRQS